MNRYTTTDRYYYYYMYTTEEFRTQVYSYYRDNGITVGDSSDGEWEQCHIVPRCEGGTETILMLHGHHIIHDIIQSSEYNRKTFWTGRTHKWLYGEGFLCENWFELVEMYEYYAGQCSSQTMARRWESLTAEERSAKAGSNTAWWATFTPKERSAKVSASVTKGWAKLTPEERSAVLAERAATRKVRGTQRNGTTSESARKAAATRRANGKQPCPTSETAHKAWATKRRKQALRSLGEDLYGALWSDGVV